jgi:hypothetical protein
MDHRVNNTIAFIMETVEHQQWFKATTNQFSKHLEKQ